MANICETKLTLFANESDISKQSEQIASFIEQHIANDDFRDTEYVSENLIEYSYVPTRWCIPEEELVKLCKQFKCNARAVGHEPGVGFVQVVCVNDKGEVAQNEEIGFVF